MAKFASVKNPLRQLGALFTQIQSSVTLVSLVRTDIGMLINSFSGSEYEKRSFEYSWYVWICTWVLFVGL